jgi:hypothetical protein
MKSLIVNRRRHIDMAQAAVEFETAHSGQRTAGCEECADSLQHAREAPSEIMQVRVRRNGPTGRVVSVMHGLLMRKRERTFEHRGFSAADIQCEPKHHVCFRSIVQAVQWISAGLTGKSSVHAACRVRRNKG